MARALLLDQRCSMDYGSTNNHQRSFVESPRRRLMSWYVQIALINFVEFAAESSRGVVLPTLFLYTKSLGGSMAFMGFLTSIFSIGRLMSSMIFGWMCDRWSFRAVYILSSTICLIGNLLYLVADEHVINSRYLLAVSRFIVGFGAGNRSVCRANVAALTTVGQRLKYLTILATVVFLGYALTPGLGSLVAHTDFYIVGIHFNKFTSPGMILVVLNCITILSMIFIYDEEVGIHDGPLETPSDGNDSDPLKDPAHIPERVISIGALIFIFLNFNARGILSIFETINIPLFLEATSSDPLSTSSVVDASNFQFYLGLLGLITYFSIEYLRHKVSDVIWLYIGFAMLLVGNLILVIAPAKISFIQLCFSELFVWSIGCPITTAVVVAAFSKLLGARPQGTLMGLMGSAGSVSRIVLPLLPGALPSLTPVFCISIALCVISILSFGWYSRMVYALKESQLKTSNDKEQQISKAVDNVL